MWVSTFSKRARGRWLPTSPRVWPRRRGGGSRSWPWWSIRIDAAVDRITKALAPDLIQLHGRETPARAREIALRTGAGVIKVLPVATAFDIDTANAFDGLVEHLMFDTKPSPDDDRPGGLGRAFDWTLLAGRRYQRPHFLAGGLDPWNVAEAIRVSGAPLVDVSSGVERGAALKHAALISAFLDAVRRA